MKYVTIKKFSQDSGYTENAIRGMIKRGVWLIDKHFKRPTPSRILLNVEAIERWVEGKAV